jgi:hypothetical protein
VPQGSGTELPGGYEAGRGELPWQRDQWGRTPSSVGRGVASPEARSAAGGSSSTRLAGASSIEASGVDGRVELPRGRQGRAPPAVRAISRASDGANLLWWL